MENNEINYTLEELEEKLTEKERLFCHQYIRDWNGTRAAKEAGYSEKSACEIGSQNLRKLHIKQYIAYIKEDIEKEVGLSKIRVLEEQMKIAFSSVGHLHDSWIERKNFEQLTLEQKACIESIKSKVLKKNIGTDDVPEIVDVEYVEIKLYDKQRALDSISKMMGYNEPEKIDHTSKGNEITGKRIVVEGLDGQQKKALLNAFGIDVTFD